MRRTARLLAMLTISAVLAVSVAAAATAADDIGWQEVRFDITLFKSGS